LSCFKGPHWTLLGNGVAHDAVRSRPGLHTFGSSGDIIDAGGHLNDAYALATGDWALVRPDGYVSAIVSSEHLDVLENYLVNVGLSAEGYDTSSR
jgi:hypothetical protein